MPSGIDALGRYNLSVMQDRVRRLLDSLQLVVDSSGNETSATVQDQSVSNTDIVNQINESLTGLYSEMIVGKESLFATTIYLSTQANYPGPYQFPPEMLQLRWMKWKDPGVPFNPVAGQTLSPIPVQWYPMVQVDDPQDWNNQEAFHSPTWRWESGGDTSQFYLNNMVAQTNANGIQANIVSLPNELVNSTDVISIPQFVRIAQQAVIYDATYTLAFSKRKQVTDEISSKRTEWHQRLIVLVENAYNTQSMQMVAPARMLRNTYTSRFRRIAGVNNRGGSW